MQHFLLSLENDALRFPAALEQAVVNKRLYGTRGVAGGTVGKDLHPTPYPGQDPENNPVPSPASSGSPAHQHGAGGTKGLCQQLSMVLTLSVVLMVTLSLPGHPSVPSPSPSSSCSKPAGPAANAYPQHFQYLGHQRAAAARN